MIFLDLVKIEVDYHRLAYDLSAQRLVQLRHDTARPFVAIVVLLLVSKDIPQCGPVQWGDHEARRISLAGWISRPSSKP